ncbi:MAG: GNAT family N-acetyltransferase [Saprospiraceae bacterium]
MKKIILQSLIPEDATQLFELVHRDRKRLATYFPVSTSAMKSLATTEQYIQSLNRKTETKIGYTFGIKTQESGDLIGLLFIKNIDWSVPKAEIAYFIDAQVSGKGIMTNAVHLLLKYSFEQLKMERIYARIAPENIGSQRVAINNGLRLEGTMRNDFRTKSGELLDVHCFGILKKEFEERKK